MNIIQLESENVKAITAISIKPNGEPVVLTGKNEQGKSSILDSIFMGLTGKLPDRPIRDGASKARINIDLGQYIIERRITQKGAYLEVRSADGEKLPAPQAILDNIIGNLTLDPLAFSKMKPKEQREVLLKAAGLDLSEWESRFRKAYDVRTEANRESKRTELHWQTLPSPPEGTPVEEVSSKSLLEKVEELREKRNFKAQAENELENLKKSREQKEADIEETHQEILLLQSKLQKQKDSLAEIESEIASYKIPEAPDPSEIQEALTALDKAEETNKQVRMLKAKEAARKEWQDAKRKAEKAEEAVQALEEEKADLLRRADFGVEGLSVDEDGVIYDGIPFHQASTARQIQISTLIAMRQNPQLKVIMIREGALIGSEIWNALVSLAKDNGYQLWVEKFQEAPGGVGLHIQEGRIVCRNGEPVEQKEPATVEAN